MHHVRKRLTYANVMSSIAVFLVLGGATALAATKIGSNEIKANAITTGKIKKEAVTTGKIKKSAINTSRLGNGSVTSEKLAPSAVTTEKIANGGVTTEKIANGGVTTEKIANGAVSAEKLAAGAVSTTSIQGANFIPRGYALVESNGKVVSGLTANIPDATVVGAAYCFDLAFKPHHAQATGEADGEGNDMPSVLVAGSNQAFSECPAATTDIEVEMWDTGTDTETTEEFYLVVW